MNAGGGGAGGGSGGGAGAGGAGGGIGGGVRGGSGFSGARIGGAECAGGLGIGIGGRGLGEAAPVSGLARFDNGPAFGAAPSGDLGGVKAGGFNLGPTWARAEIGGGPQVKEGPAGLENTMPLQIGQDKPVKEIRFNNPVKGSVSVEPLPAQTEQAAVRAAEAIIAQAHHDYLKEQKLLKVPVTGKFVSVITNSLYDRTPNWYALPHPVFAPALEPATRTENALGVQTSLQTKTEAQVSTKNNQAVSTQLIIKEQEVEEVQEVPIENKEAEKNEEQTERVKFGLVEDVLKTQTREAELDQAVELAAAEAQALGEGVEGWRIVKKLVPQHPGDRSETLNEEDPLNTILDGSWESAKADIKTRKFGSVEEAKKAASAINKRYRPEKRGEVDDITEEEHQRVHRNHEHSSKKPPQILEKRTAKKVRQSAGVNTNPPQGWTVGWAEGDRKINAETSLKKLGLEEVLAPKAA